jgi:hypothetical protein
MAVDGHKLLLFDRRTRKWVELARGYVDNRAWSRDGKYLYYDIFFETDLVVVRVRISDRHTERVASLKGVRRAFATYGPWGGLSLDGSPVVVRDVGIEEIYALDWEVP